MESPIKNKEKNPHEGHRERMRRRFFAEGLDAFAEHEVLELALFYALARGDTNTLAHRLLKRFGSLAGVLEADSNDVASMEGVGEKTAAFLSFIPQLARRYLKSKYEVERICLNTSEAAMAFAFPLMTGRPQEVFYVVSLNAACRVLNATLLAEGTVTAVNLHPRKVVEVALRNRAASVIFIHNHPAGTAKPSTDDLRLTETLMKIFKPLSIKILDHIIVAGDQAYSFAKEQVLPKV